MQRLTCSVLLLLILLPLAHAEENLPTAVIPPRETFEIAGQPAFVILPSVDDRQPGPLPWVWYAPTLGKNLPGKLEVWMFSRFLKQGIAIAGIDVGESFGNPEGRDGFQALYEELTKNRGFGTKPVLLARSRGGLMLYNLSLIHISEPTRLDLASRMPSSA